MALTLAQLRTAARERADMTNSTFISDSELNLYINTSYSELYDLLVARFEDYFLKTPAPQSTITSGNTIDLPADFYKLRGLDLQSSPGEWVTVTQYNFTERNVRNRGIDRIRYGILERSYRVMGQKIYLLPESESTGTYRIWYIPRFTRLSADGDVMGDVLDFEDYVIVDAAIKMLLKEESDAGAMMMVKEQLKSRIQSMASNRDVGSPERVADVSLQLTETDFYFPRG